jgi:hypothetical protein
MRCKACQKPVERRWLGEVGIASPSVLDCGSWSDQNGSGTVNLVFHETLTKDSHPGLVGSIAKNGIDIKMRRVNPDRSRGTRIIFDKDQIAEEWPASTAELAVMLSAAKVVTTANRFFGAIVRIVAKRRASE